MHFHDKHNANTNKETKQKEKRNKHKKQINMKRRSFPNKQRIYKATGIEELYTKEKQELDKVTSCDSCRWTRRARSLIRRDTNACSSSCQFE
jgi:hypothetical protein